MENKKAQFTYHLIMEDGTHGNFTADGIFNTNPETGVKSLVVAAVMTESKMVDVEEVEGQVVEEPGLFDSPEEE